MKKNVNILAGLIVFGLLIIAAFIQFKGSTEPNDLNRIYTANDFPLVDANFESTISLIEQLNRNIKWLSEHKDTPDYDTWVHVGNLKLALEDFEGAKAAYDRAIEISDDRPLAYLNLGTLYKQHLGDYNVAEDYYEQAMDRIVTPFYSDYTSFADLYVTYVPEKKERVEEIMLLGASKIGGVDKIQFYHYLYLFFFDNDEKRELYKNMILELNPNYELPTPL